MAKANRANGSRGFPKEIKLPNGAAITLRLMEHSDKEKILAFARSLPQDDHAWRDDALPPLGPGEG